MKDEFDKILSNKIKEVIDNQDIPYNPEHWKMLLHKKEKKNKKAFFFWKVAAFMVFLLVAGGGIYTFLNTTPSFENSTNPQIILDQKDDSIKKDVINKNDKIHITYSLPDTLVENQSNLSQLDSSKIHISKKVNILNQQENKLTNLLATKENLKNDKKPVTDYLLLDFKNNIDEIVEESKISATSTIKDSIKVEKLNTDIENQKATNKLTALEEKNITEESSISKNKNLKIGINIAPSFSYTSENQNSNTSIAGGISVELPLSKKFDISAGVLYSNQKLDLNKPSNYLNDAVSYSNSSQIVDKNTELEGIEIPINVKYNFSVNNRDVFVAIGFSSTSNFNENTTSNYIVNSKVQSKTKDDLGNTILKYEIYQVDKKVVSPTNSGGFEFANILNASLGINLPINSNQFVIVEPYFKYYISPITQEKVDVFGGGIHLRYIFSIKKK